MKKEDNSNQKFFIRFIRSRVYGLYYQKNKQGSSAIGYTAPIMNLFIFNRLQHLV